MNPQQPHKDIPIFISRIKETLSGDIGGTDAASLAWYYAEAVEEANKELAELAAMLGHGASIDVYARLHRSPSLADALKELDFEESQSWKQCCEKFDWRMPIDANKDLAGIITDAFGNIDNQKDWLMENFRKRVFSEKDQELLNLITLLTEISPDDEELQSEFKRIRDLKIKEVETELIGAIADPKINAAELLHNFRSQGLVLEGIDGPIKDAVDAESVKLTKEATKRVNTLLKNEKGMTNVSAWKGLEREYLECSQFIESNNLMDSISIEHQSSLESIKEKLSNIRGAFEFDIQMNDTLAIINGKGHSKHETQSARERLTRLKSHAESNGYPIPNDLENQISELSPVMKEEQNKPKTALYASIGAAAVIVIGAGIFFMSSSDDSNGSANMASNNPVPPPNIERLTPEELGTAGGQESEGAGEETVEPEAVEPEPVEPEPVEPEVVEPEVRPEDEYVAVADKIESIVGLGFSTGTQQEVIKLVKEASQYSTLTSDEAKATSQRIKTLVSNFNGLKNERFDELETIISHRLSLAQGAVAKAIVSSESEFSQAYANATDAIEQVEKVNKKASNLDDSVSGKEIASLKASLKMAKGKWDSLAGSRKQLLEATNLQDFYAPLESIRNMDIISEEEQVAITETLERQPDLAQIMQQLIMPYSADSWDAFTSAEPYMNTQVSLGAREKSFIRGLMDDSTFASVYVSNVKFYQGKQQPSGESKVLLAAPVFAPKNIDNYSFKVRDFDDNGFAADVEKSVNLLKRPDGSIWGYFYESSILTEESKYYKAIIKPELQKISAGGTRSAVFDLLSKINLKTNLAPAYRAYWSHRLISFMELDPWKWGLAFAPSLKEQKAAITKIEPRGITKQKWLSTAEQKFPSPELSKVMDAASKEDSLIEAKSVSALLSFAAQGELVPVGYADLNGKIQYTPKLMASDRLWTVEPATGKVALFEEGKSTAAFTPILTYRYKGYDLNAVIKKADKDTGLNFSSSPYRELLPPLFSE